MIKNAIIKLLIADRVIIYNDMCFLSTISAMKYISFYFTVPVAAYDMCWFMGDQFASHSFEQYFRSRDSRDYNGYVKAHFDVRGFFNSNFTTDNPSVIGCMGNLMYHAISSKNSEN